MAAIDIEEGEGEMFSAFERIAQFVIASVMVAVFGGVIGLTLSGGKAGVAAAGASIGVAVVVVTWIIRSITAPSQGEQDSAVAPVAIAAGASQPPPAVAQPLAASTPQGARAFVSWCRTDADEAQAADYLEQVLETAGFERWGDAPGATTGPGLPADVAQRIRAASFFVPLLSRQYLASERCLEEFELAAQAGVPMRALKLTEGRLVPPPHLRALYDQYAGSAVYLDMTARDAPHKLRELAESMLRERVSA